MNRLLSLASLASLTALVLAGCGGTTTTTGDVPTTDEYATVAQTVASAQATGAGGGDLGAMADVIHLARGMTPAGFSQSGSGGVAGQHFGVTYDYTVTCEDAMQHVLAACGAQTAEASATVAWSGDLTLPWFSAKVSDNSDWDIASFAADTTSVNGNGMLVWDSSLSQQAGAVVAAYHLELDAHDVDVLLDATTLQPVGGEIDYQISATHTLTTNGTPHERDLDITAVVKFTGAGGVTITLDGDVVYTVDLTTGGVTAVQSR